jgi:hypothetical protein
MYVPPRAWSGIVQRKVPPSTEGFYDCLQARSLVGLPNESRLLNEVTCEVNNDPESGYRSDALVGRILERVLSIKPARPDSKFRDQREAASIGKK